jgi:hypothetical protein
MPNCFSLTRKSNPEAGAVPLAQVDKEMCEHFNVPCNPVKYYQDWYNWLGYGFAMGRSFDDMRAYIKEHDNPELMDHDLEIVDWMEANFTPDAWAEIGRRS